VYPLTARQFAHVATIRAGATERGLPRLAAVYAVACSGAESSLTNWENSGTSTKVGKAEGRQLNPTERAVARRSLGLGDGVPPWGDNLDSMGLFAQRPMTGWGAPEDIMRPAYAVGRFLDALVTVTGWRTLPAEQVIAAVQGYYDPTIYTAWLATADAVVPRN
jgi:hypothetical protein